MAPDPEIAGAPELRTTRRSIRRELTTMLLLGLLALCVATGLTTWAIARQALTRQFDTALLAKARALATLLQREEDDEYEFDFADEMMPEFSRTARPDYFQLWGPDGKLLESSRSLKRHDLPHRQPPVDQAVFYDVRLPGAPGPGRPGRAVTLVFVPHDERDDPSSGESAAEASAERPAAGPPATVVVAQSREPLDYVLATLLGVIGGGICIIPLAGAVLVFWAVRRGLHPLTELERQVQEIGPADRKARLRLPDPPAEIEPVQTKLNSLLDRLQEAFERERRFTSDVSHELRTPLSEARMAIELAARWPEDAELHAKSCQDALDSVDHMHSLVTKLLLLIRSDAGKLPVGTETRVDLVDITQSLLDTTFWLRASDRGIDVVVESDDSPTRVLTDATLLQLVLRNLIDNALEYAPAGTRIDITIASRDGHLEWSVRNDAPDLGDTDIGEMTQPFWRKDPSRTGDTHSGLGLSLVDSIARQLGLTVRLSLDGVRRFHAAVQFGCGASSATELVPLQPAAAGQA